MERSNGAGRPPAQPLLADGERVVDVPAELSARAPLFDAATADQTRARPKPELAFGPVGGANGTFERELHPLSDDRTTTNQERAYLSRSSNGGADYSAAVLVSTAGDRANQPPWRSPRTARTAT